MNIILKDPFGNIIKDSSGRILKNRPFNETVIQDGLEFWGAADPNYLTLVDGLVSEAYDIRGTGKKMIQNTIVNRLSFENNYLIGYSNLKQLASNFTSNFITPFFVLKNIAGVGVNFRAMLTNTNWGQYGIVDLGYINQYPTGYFFKNLSKVNTAQSYTNSVIIHSLSSINVNNTNVFVGCNNSGGSGILSFGWYNRVLSESEVIYNINALNAKYQIF